MYAADAKVKTLFENCELNFKPNHSHKQLSVGQLFFMQKMPSRYLSTPYIYCLLYTSPSPRDRTRSRMPSSA